MGLSALKEPLSTASIGLSSAGLHQVSLHPPMSGRREVHAHPVAAKESPQISRFVRVVWHLK
jgi:hypothetical protein